MYVLSFFDLFFTKQILKISLLNAFLHKKHQLNTICLTMVYRFVYN